MNFQKADAQKRVISDKLKDFSIISNNKKSVIK